MICIIFFSIIYTSPMIIFFTSWRHYCNFTKAIPERMLNSILTGRYRMEWQIVPLITNTAVTVVPIQRTSLFDRIPEIALISVVFPVPGPPVIKFFKDHTIQYAICFQQFCIPDVVPCSKISTNLIHMSTHIWICCFLLINIW